MSVKLYTGDECADVERFGQSARFVPASDYAALEAERDALKEWRAQVTVAFGSGNGGARYDEVAAGIMALKAKNAKLRKAVEQLQTVLPDSRYYEDACWKWCWEELHAEAQDLVKQARIAGDLALSEVES